MLITSVTRQREVTKMFFMPPVKVITVSRPRFLGTMLRIYYSIKFTASPESCCSMGVSLSNLYGGDERAISLSTKSNVVTRKQDTRISFTTRWRLIGTYRYNNTARAAINHRYIHFYQTIPIRQILFFVYFLFFFVPTPAKSKPQSVRLAFAIQSASWSRHQRVSGIVANRQLRH